MDAPFLGITELVEAPSVTVVVDVMRAFTVAAWAFAQGAEEIVLAESPGEALALKDRHPDGVALKDGPPAPGFDLVNSPGLLRSVDLGGRTVVQKTTAGTVGAHGPDPRRTRPTPDGRHRDAALPSFPGGLPRPHPDTVQGPW